MCVVKIFICKTFCFFIAKVSIEELTYNNDIVREQTFINRNENFVIYILRFFTKLPSYYLEKNILISNVY